MFKTIQEQNEYIEMLVKMSRQQAAWLGAEAMDAAEAKVRHDWNTMPATPWHIKAQREIDGLRQQLTKPQPYELSSVMQQRISNLECELACQRAAA
jgi:hypothetical protein